MHKEFKHSALDFTEILVQTWKADINERATESNVDLPLRGLGNSHPDGIK